MTYAHDTGHCASGMNQPVLFSASRPIESEPPATGLPAAVVAAPAAVVAPPAAVVLLELFLLSPPQAAATEASTTPTAMAFHASERVENKVSPNRASPREAPLRVTEVTPPPGIVERALTRGQLRIPFRIAVRMRRIQSGDAVHAPRRTRPSCPPRRSPHEGPVRLRRQARRRRCPRRSADAPVRSCRAASGPRSRRSVLLVLQAMDAGGKDGTIRSVFSGVNPQGVRVVSFKVPTAQELLHDYLWRVHAPCPRRRRDRHLQPLALRGHRGGAGAPVGAARAVEAAVPPHP